MDDSVPETDVAGAGCGVHTQPSWPERVVRLEEMLDALRLRTAVDIYLRHAYDDADAAARHAVDFPDGESVAERLVRFEDTTDPGPEAHRRYELRLGSQEYPNMKLAIHEAWIRAEFILTVDRHDAFTVASNVPDYGAWMEVRERNRRRKVAIEKAWYDAGLPTARRFKEERLRPEDCAAVLGQREILVVDDDTDASEVVALMLGAAGFRSHVASGVVEARAYLADPATDCGMALVDVMLEDGPGYDVVAAIRQTPRLQEIPVLLMTGLSHSDIMLRDANVHFLRKPYNGAQLVRMVRETLLGEFGIPDRFVREESDTARDARV